MNLIHQGLILQSVLGGPSDSRKMGTLPYENPPIELKGIKLTQGAQEAFKIILDRVPQPVRPFVELLMLHGAEQMAESQNEKNVREGDIVFSFWMGTPETSKEEVKNFLKSKDLLNMSKELECRGEDKNSS